MSKKKLITSYVSVFEGNLDKLRKKIKKELDKPRKDRNRSALKDMLKEANSLKKTIKECKEHSTKKCPHCGEKL